MNGYSAPEAERDSSNFDFRTVALLTMMVTKPDLLHEYLADGAAKEPDGTPVALTDPRRWATLRGLGLPPEILAESLFIFERKDVQAACSVMQKAFATAVAYGDYCDVGCPPPDWYKAHSAYCKDSCQSLNRPGVQVEVLQHA
jgi:hypothetical protein